MNCEKCGNPIEENENACKVCGELADKNSAQEMPSAQDGARIENEEELKRPIRHTEFNWNVYDFPKPKKTEDLDLKWSIEQETAERLRREAQNALDSNAETGGEALEQTEKTEDETMKEAPGDPVEIGETEEAPVPQTAKEPDPEAVEPTAEKKAEAEAALEKSVSEIERFFTFTKKNEQFQLLLDREYEKLKKRREGEPYIEPEIDFKDLREVEESFQDMHSDFDQMILEGTTPAEDAAPVVDLLRRRTIPVDLDQIQQEVRRAGARWEADVMTASAQDRPSPQETKAVSEGEKTPDQQQALEPDLKQDQEQGQEQDLKQDLNLTEEEPLPSIELQKKSVEEILSDYPSIEGEGENGEENTGWEELPEAEESQNTPPEECVRDVLDEHLAKMAAARDSILKQLEEEKEALRRAEEEASRKGLLNRNEPAYSPSDLGSGPVSQETSVNRMFSGANAEIQVTVAVKANGGLPQQGYAAEPVRVTVQPAQEEPKRTPQEDNPYTRTRVIDAEAVRVIKEKQEQKVASRRHEMQAAEVAEEKPAPPEPAKKILPVEEPWHENTLNSLFPMEPQGSEEPPQEKPEKKSRVGSIILTIIVIVLAVEILALGIKYAAPESQAASVVNSAEAKIAEVFGGAVESVSQFFKGLSGESKDSENEDGSDGKDQSDKSQQEGTAGAAGEDGENGTQTAAPDPVPMADKTALIATQLDKNKNIKEIVASEELKYVPGKNYGSKDINSSKAIEYNIWKTLSTGETLYYDRAVVGAVIAFDSQWQDYVNNGIKDVLTRTKEGSAAYQNAVSYSKVGKETQSFESLEIGEIRVGSSGSFYIWTKEQINKTENGKTKSVTYKWIYQLEPEFNEMKIVSCTKF